METFACKKCSENFGSLETLEEHLVVHHMRFLRFKCPHCCLFAPTADKMAQHIEQSHSGKPSEFLFMYDKQLEADLRAILFKSEVKEMCNVEAKTKGVTSAISKRKEEIKLEGEENDVKCLSPSEYPTKLITITLDSPSPTPGLNRNSSSQRSPPHAGGRSSNWQTKDDTAAVDTNRQEDSANKRNKTLQCQKCDAHVRETDILSHAMALHRNAEKLACRHCSYRVASAAWMSKHIGIAHPGMPVADGCVKVPMSSQGLTGLLDRCFPQREQPQPKKKAATKRSLKRTVACALCGRSVEPVAFHLRTHIYVHHLEEAVFGCKICAYTCRVREGMRRHSQSKHRFAAPDADRNVIDHTPRFGTATKRLISKCFPGHKIVTCLTSTSTVTTT